MGSGGDYSEVQVQLAGGAQAIHSAAYAFAALKADGSVVAWAHLGSGGDCSEVQGQLAGGAQAIHSATHYAFAALKADGRASSQTARRPSTLQRMLSPP